jgi:hypothetical protein
MRAYGSSRQRRAARAQAWRGPAAARAAGAGRGEASKAQRAPDEGRQQAERRTLVATLGQPGAPPSRPAPRPRPSRRSSWPRSHPRHWPAPSASGWPPTRSARPYGGFASRQVSATDLAGVMVTAQAVSGDAGVLDEARVNRIRYPDGRRRNRRGGLILVGRSRCLRRRRGAVRGDRPL